MAKSPILLYERLKVLTEISFEELQLAAEFREALLPARSDSLLLGRMSYSSAGNTFETIRFALQREFLLSLAKIWDKRGDVVNMYEAGRILARADVIDVIVTDRLSRNSFFDYATMKSEIMKFITPTTTMIKNYERGGVEGQITSKIEHYRHKFLAHRSTDDIIVSVDLSDEEVNKIWIDTKSLVQNLFHIVKATAMNIDEYSNDLQRCSSFFWNGVRSERDATHPSYRKPIVSVLR